MKVSHEKYENLKQLVNEEGAIAALAIDQRGSMEKMMGKANPDLNNVEGIGKFKELVSSELTKYSSSILLDPIYGMKGVEAKDKNAGLIMSYEQTGYDEYEEGRLPRLINFVSGLRIKEMGANAVKVLLYYDIDESEEINDIKKAWVERVGYECEALGLPYFLEIVNYDAKIDDAKGIEYSKLRPKKVIESMKVFDDPRYKVDVLKVEAPVNMNFVEGYGEGEILHTRDEALKYFKDQSDATSIPFIFLSGGVSADLFKETLKFAKEAGSTFNGVLCGRATWRGAVDVFGKSEKDAKEWLNTEGKDNIVTLNEVIKETATSVFEKIEEE
ncbi:tagatose 1,6-diphosphate aldolase [Anaerococcus sp. Marseille-Q7828]|uniref:tagatose 1,6-diphosphate aldolase n=1 Tax=Anaerococcus sp. Marseille-Q7828 TaxID=3036300 RepID=UPI0024ACCFBB|nr:tagatose 1,6-diphosphate aldolase [Anaerococcus sp. Marseille-Q7828]